MDMNILIGVLALLACASFVGFFYAGRWTLRKLDEHFAAQAAKHREMRMRRYSMTEFRGAGKSS